ASGYSDADTTAAPEPGLAPDAA
ncbi:MAG: hypothetical protein QOC64_1459, partial [Solirubrobacteraceae bacterium]|nr:hypothetical protein [Solirubrobacteraceae bacterium]